MGHKIHLIAGFAESPLENAADPPVFQKDRAAGVAMLAFDLEADDLPAGLGALVKGRDPAVVEMEGLQAFVEAAL